MPEEKDLMGLVGLLLTEQGADTLKKAKEFLESLEKSIANARQVISIVEEKRVSLSNTFGKGVKIFQGLKKVGLVK